MTRIVLKSDAAAVFGILKTPLRVLLHPTVIAFRESSGLLYVADQYADAIISRLAEAGVSVRHWVDDGRPVRNSTSTPPSPAASKVFAKVAPMTTLLKFASPDSSGVSAAALQGRGVRLSQP